MSINWFDGLDDEINYYGAGSGEIVLVTPPKNQQPSSEIQCADFVVPLP